MPIQHWKALGELFKFLFHFEIRCKFHLHICHKCVPTFLSSFFSADVSGIILGALIITQPDERGCMNGKTTKDTDHQEKRSSPRYESIKKIKYKVLIPMEGEGFTQNISRGGFALFLDKEVPPGSVLELKFQIPGKNKEPEKSIVKVIWQRDYLTGVKVLGH